MQLNNDGKVCIECQTDLGRFFGRNFCEECFRELLKANLEEEDKRHAENAVSTS